MKAEALAGIAKALTVTDPDRAVRLIADAERSVRSVSKLQNLSRMFSDDPTTKAEALASIAEALAATDPHGAERIAQSITDKRWRVSALVGITEA